jgi:hypothetical protein
MPEFHLDTTGADDKWAALPEATQGFIEALFFTETCSGEDAHSFGDPDTQHRLAEGQLDGTIPCDRGFAHLHPDDLAEIESFVAGWTAKNAELVAEATAREGYDLTRLGRDLLYTHNGHGTGFWDRPELEAGDLGERLTEAAGNGEIVTDYDHGDVIRVDIL